jgi:methylated-DNA-protein-cysteine methyltransferase related protein
MEKQKSSKNRSFYEKVYEIVRLIPEGKVSSYGAIANYIGSGLSARMVGYAMNKSGLCVPPVPAHRVVNRNGLLTGKHHFDYPELMQELLENEGFEIINDKIVEFNARFWDPEKELG